LNETCSLCQVKLYSSSCKTAHRLLCNSKGFFGYFCNLCQKFNYGSSGTTSDILKQHHICNTKTCKFCYKPQETDHLCHLTIPKLPKYHANLCFLHIESINQDPIACVLLNEVRTGYFENILIAKEEFGLQKYFKPKDLLDDFGGFKIEGDKIKNTKKLQDLIHIEEQIKKSKDNFNKQFLQLMLQERFRGTTILVSDEDSTNMVCMILN